jgi:hypothetical protein
MINCSEKNNNHLTLSSIYAELSRMFNVRWKEVARRGERKMKETDPLSMEIWWPRNLMAQIKELNI